MLIIATTRIELINFDSNGDAALRHIAQRLKVRRVLNHSRKLRKASWEKEDRNNG